MKRIAPSFSGLPRAPKPGALLAWFSFLIALFGAHPAIANDGSLGEVFCTAANNISPFANVFNWFAWVAGALFVTQGVVHLKGYYENPNQHPMQRIVAMLSGGAFLMALPSVIGTLIASFFPSGDANAGGMIIAGCSIYAGATSTGGAVPLDQMLANFVGNIQAPLVFLVTTVSITLGIYLIVRGLLKASKYGTDAKTTSATSIVTNLLIGTFLCVLGQNIDMIRASVTGDTGSLTQFEALSWTSLQNTGVDVSHFRTAIKAALTFFQLVGLISFVRGWNVIRNAVEGVGQATVAQGITHIVGGVLAINIYLFMEIMDKTFGTAFVT